MQFQCLRKVGKFIVEQNEMVYLPRGLLLTNPAERGLRIVSFDYFIIKFSTYLIIYIILPPQTNLVFYRSIFVLFC